MRTGPSVSSRAVAGSRLRAAARIGACALLMAAFGQPSPIAAQTRPEAAAPALPPPGPESRLHDRVNSHRGSIGCRPLDWHAPSASVAEARSADMIARRYFDHWTPDGRNVFDELAEAGIEARGSIGENIALSHAGPASVLELWRDSPPHRRNLDNCSFTHHGLGERGGVWTQILLAQPQRAAARAPVGPSESVESSESRESFSPSEPASPPR